MSITINGSGTISGITVGGLPDGIITQPDLSTNVAGNGPAFSAYMSSNQTVSNATQTKLQYNTKNFDTNNNYDTTNYRFLPTVAGYYMFTAFCSPGNGTGVLTLNFYKNGTQFWQGAGAPNYSSATFPLAGSSFVYLNGTTDYVEVYGYQSSGGNLVFYSGATISGFAGYMVRGA